MSRFLGWARESWVVAIWILGTLLVIVVAVMSFARARSEPAAPAPAPSATASSTTSSPVGTPTSVAPPAPSSPPTVPTGEALKAVAASYTRALQYGSLEEGGGGPTWVAKLNATATPALVKAAAMTDPGSISNAPITAVTVEAVNPDGSGTVKVVLGDGVASRLIVVATPAGLRVAADERAKP